MCPTGDGCTSDATYLLCVNEVHRDLITTTAAISALSSFLMGLFANLPVGLAPGLGLNAYVRALSCYHTFHVTLTCAKVYLFHRRCFHGTGIVTYREVLAAVFMEGYVTLLPRGAMRSLFEPSGQMDFRDLIIARSSSMARSHHATVSHPRCRSWYRPFHCVICVPFSRFSPVKTTFSFIGLCMRQR